MKIKPTIVVIPILLLFNIACSVGDRSIELTDTGEDNNISCPINIDKHDYDVDGSKRMDITDMSDYSDAGTYTGSDVVIGCDGSIYCQSNRLSGVEEVSVGGEHTCSLQYGGKVKCWGKNVDGQLGDGSNKNKNSPVDVVGLSSGVVAVSAGNSHTCALLENGGVKCWGDNSAGQLGNGNNDNKNTPVLVICLESGIKAISAGGSHTCALLENGGVKCWGDNSAGQLGNGNNVNVNIPLDVAGLASGVKAISAGGSHTCALLENGGVKCWGDNSAGQLGNGNNVDVETPAEVKGLQIEAISISTGLGKNTGHTCAILVDKRITCWGDDKYGQLGNGTEMLSYSPIDVTNLESEAIKISSGGSHTCTLLDTGGVKCWGDNQYGQLGNGNNENTNIPVYVTGLISGVKTISAGGYHTCALLENGGVKCWGRNTSGQLGNGNLENRNVPVDVIGLSSGVKAISAGDYHTCALLENGGVKCWGKNMSAQVGNGTYEDKNTPVDITGLSSGVNSISAGNLYTCVLLDKGKAECWRNWGAELSIDIEIDAVSAISVGGFHSCVILNNGGARCWGSNNYGQLGYGSGIYESYTPVDVEGLDKGVKEISAGYYHTCALLDKGEIKCWGLNNYGQLGNELDTKSFNPIDVEGLTAGVIEISAGGEGLYSHTCALLNTGGVKCWGSNYYGQLGNDINGISTLPVYVVCQ